MKLKKRNLHDVGEETDGKRVSNMQRKKKEKGCNVDLSSEHPQVISTEKPKVELKKKKSKRMAEEINSCPVDGKPMKQRKVKRSKHSQPGLEVISNEKVKGRKNKRKAEEISSTSVDDHLKRGAEGDKSLNMADNGTEIRNRKTKKKKMENERLYQISSGDEDCSRGMKRWVTDYYESRPGLDELQKRIDDFMTAHEEGLEEERQNREAKAAQGGWTVVVHHKGRKKTTDSESGIAVGSVSQAALEDKIAKKKQSEPVAHGFYRFQRREAQRNEILALQSKFEQDKKRIQQIRAARKFKPC